MISSGVVLWGYSLKTTLHIQTSWLAQECLFCINKYFKKIIPIILGKLKPKCSFNVLIYHVALLKMSWDSIIAADFHLDPVLPVSLFCFLYMFPVQAMQLIWEGGHSFVQSQRESVKSTLAEAAFLLSQVSLLQLMRQPLKAVRLSLFK